MAYLKGYYAKCSSYFIIAEESLANFCHKEVLSKEIPVKTVLIKAFCDKWDRVITCFFVLFVSNNHVYVLNFCI